MKILDGKKTAEDRAEAIRQKIDEIGITPKIVIVRVGDRADSKSYVKRKVKYAETVGINAHVEELPGDIAEAKLIEVVETFNRDEEVHGIIVQLPLPEHINEKNVIDWIQPSKDVDGLSDENINKLFANEPGIVPATPRGILTLLQSYGVEVEGKHVVVLGRSRLVGKSVALLMLNHNATVTMCHSRTQNLPEITKAADILIVAIGKQRFITKEHVRDGQVIIDVGIGADEDKKIVGDVDFDALKDMDISISPVPGGVGPMTVASLFENLLEVAKK